MEEAPRRSPGLLAERTIYRENTYFEKCKSEKRTNEIYTNYVVNKYIVLSINLWPKWKSTELWKKL